jgi:ABC-2 type transport system permease protein
MMGIGQAITMPLFFASNAIYPIAIMPTWLQVIAVCNPLTYEVYALRSLMLAGGTITSGLIVDFAVMLVTAIILVIIGAKLYPRVAV